MNGNDSNEQIYYSVWRAVCDVVGNSLCDVVRHSVSNSVGYSIGYSLWNSVDSTIKEYEWK